jgi:DNA-binding GntR family transcriptional regulator
MIDIAVQAPLPVLRAQRSTMQDHVYRQLCDLILNGEIAPGQLITIQTLADAFGVSAMPVREALQRLTAARVLTVVSGRTIGVPPLINSSLMDLRRVRLEVEALAGQWATPKIGETHLKRLDNLIAEMNEAARAGDRKQYALCGGGIRNACVADYEPSRISYFVRAGSIRRPLRTIDCTRLAPSTELEPARKRPITLR